MDKILIIQTAFPGDVILVTPLLRRISEQLPGSAVTLMVIPQTQNIVENNPFLNQLWVYDKHGAEKGLRGFFRMMTQIKKEQFGIALLPHRSYRSALLARLTGIPVRIGFNRSPAKWLYTDVVSYQYDQHEVSRNLNLLQPLGVQDHQITRPELYPSTDDESVIDDLFDQNKLDGSQNLIALAPGSVWFTKQWPASYYVQLADLFIEKGFKVCLLGGNEDIPLGDFFKNGRNQTVFNFIGQLSIRQSAALLKRCQVLISNDSAPTHLGSAMNVPTITIYGSTVPAFGFGPIAEKHWIMHKDMACRPCTDHGREKCPIKTLACLKEISPEQVFHESLKLIKENISYENV